MIVGVLTVELFLPSNGSLKDKRQTVKSLKQRVKNRFNVSIAEVGEQDLWQKSVLGVACVGTDTAFVNQVLDSVMNVIHGTPLVQVVDYRMDIV
jgi:uncharacterized protein YlxP (DUF503 family)